MLRRSMTSAPTAVTVKLNEERKVQLGLQYKLEKIRAGLRAAGP